MQGAIDWLFRNRRTGAITIAQTPNVPLVIVLAAFVAGAVTGEGAARTAFDVVGLAALAWWSVDELVRGVNPWRRLLGVAGLGFVASGVQTLVSGAG